MPENTPRLNIPKPLGNEYFNRQALNEILDAIEANAETVTGSQEKINQAITNLINSSPSTLDTLKELADALGNDPNFATTVLNRLTEIEQDDAAHKADDTSHITATERTTWNSKETPDGARKKVEQTDFKVYKTNKDSEGIFTTVEYKRADGTLAVKAVLSGGTSPQYTTRTITYYGLDGVTVEKTTPRTLSYDADGVLISEV